MVFHIKIFLTLCLAAIGASTGRILNISVLVNVLNYGAVGNAHIDDSHAFMKAWEVVCAATTDNNIGPTLVIPPKKIFLLKPVTFQGPCKSENIHVQVGGSIIAPGELSDWSGYDKKTWLVFWKVNGLTVRGDGLIDGNGINWWRSCGNKNQGCSRPTALTFLGCNNVQLSGLRHINSQRNHISISNCFNVSISKIYISAPETSPNTDGIDISWSTNIHISNSYIGTGDDCIALNSGLSYINITGVTCGPGHGISIGSLGKGGEDDTVEEVHVKHCTFIKTQNGARIKTWQGGSGYARKISFENITFIDTNNPIIIDQFYCPDQSCSKKTSSAVKISDVSYIRIHGTSMKEDAINLICDKVVGCTNVVLGHINITSVAANNRTYASCLNAHGTSFDSFPRVSCLLP